MKVVIFEDEAYAADHLEKMLHQLIPGIEVLARISTVRKGIEWLKANTCDLIFLDINLADGLSFSIFEHVAVKIPVIFTTAYDQYAIKAFEVNSLDYLLKPISIENLKRSLSKYNELVLENKSRLDIDALINAFNNPDKAYRERFTVEFGDKITVVQVDDIAYFFSENKFSYIRTHSGKTYPIDYSLDKLAIILNPKVFFRINRAYIVCLKAISAMNLMGSRSVKVTLNPPSSDIVMVSNSRYSEFKTWLNI